MPTRPVTLALTWYELVVQPICTVPTLPAPTVPEALDRVHRRTGNLPQQRRGLRRLQRREVASQQIGFFGTMREHAAESFAKLGMAAEQARQRSIDGLLGAIEMIAQAPAQAAEAITIHGLVEHRLRIEPGDKTL